MKTHNVEEDTPTWPIWMRELDRSLAARSQFVLFGNIRDVQLVPIENDLALLSIIDCIWEVLSPRGTSFILHYNPTNGLAIIPSSQDDAAKDFFSNHDLSLKEHPSLEEMGQYIAVIARTNSIRSAVIIDYASRIAIDPSELQPHQQEFYSACEKSSYDATQVALEGRDDVIFNPVIWLFNNESDVPGWFAAGNDLIRLLAVPKPDFSNRYDAASMLGSAFLGFDEATRQEREKYFSQFSDLSEGLTLKAMEAITDLARDAEIPFHHLSDAVRGYKVGLPDNPWKKSHIKEKVRDAEVSIRKRVKGQERAITKTLDILKRSVMGLTGAHASIESNTPRGVLFFAGPTGVGKTMLAKAITKEILGNENAYIRFDMSEFSAEHAQDRLIGAPPGYVGHDAGGELTNAIRQKPFSVVLFDEIEKAHPKILDKFLQILDDGRLTDGRGNTVYFTEAVIIFTSNLGIFVKDVSGKRIQNVDPDKDDYESVENKVHKEIDNYFKEELNRPELLNRIGDNIVVFDFIRPGIAEQIFSIGVNNVMQRVHAEHGITIELSDKAEQTLKAWCTADELNGGRGIGKRIESMLINPLARKLFERIGVHDEFDEDVTLTIEEIRSTESGYQLVVR